MRIGILGGTFNPVHIGHLILAEQMHQILGLDKIIFIPVYLPPHKKNIKDIVSAEDRLKMLGLAIGDNPNFEASTVEIKRRGISYSAETLKELCLIYKKAEFFLLVGSDERIDTWKEAGEILRICDVIVANRPGYKKLTTRKTFYRNYPELKTRTISITPVDISSSLIRRYLRESKSVRYLIPDKVYSYIIQKRLYVK